MPCPTRPPLSRRTVIRGRGQHRHRPALAGDHGTGQARAAAPAGPARRFVGVFQPGGTVRAKYTPTGSETAFTLGPILKPLEPMQEPPAGARRPGHEERRRRAAPGGHRRPADRAPPRRTAAAGYAAGPSIDQVIATRISAGKKPRASIQMAVRWATGRSKGRLHPINVAQLRGQRHLQPHPARAWTRRRSSSDLFGTATGPGRRRRRRGSRAPQVDPRLRRPALPGAGGPAGRGRPAEARAAPDQAPRDRARPGHARLRADAHAAGGLPGAGQGGHLGLQPAHRASTPTTTAASSTPAPTPPSPRSASS